MKKRCEAVFLVLVGLIFTIPARGEAPAAIGAQVVTKYKTALRVGNRVVNDGSHFHVYTVDRVNGDWLWLVSGRVAGWTRASEVVPLDKAVDYYTEQIRLNPKSAHAYLCRGAVLDEKGRTDAAIADYNQALRLDPKYVAALNNRGTVLLDKGLAKEAIADYNEALRLNPSYVASWFNRGVAWLNQGKRDKAVADFTVAIQLDPGDARIFDERGVALLELGERVPAIADFTRAIGLDPTNARAVYHRGLAQLERGNSDKAIIDLTEAIRLDPKRWTARAALARGTAWKRKREYAKAIADFEEVVRIDPRNSSAHNNLAYIRAACSDDRFRDGPQAVALATRACALAGKELPNNFATLAAAYAESGDFDKAVEMQEKANRLLTDGPNKTIGAERLKLYKAKTPYHEAPDVSPSRVRGARPG